MAESPLSPWDLGRVLLLLVISVGTVEPFQLPCTTRNYRHGTRVWDPRPTTWPLAYTMNNWEVDFAESLRSMTSERPMSTATASIELTPMQSDSFVSSYAKPHFNEIGQTVVPSSTDTMLSWEQSYANALRSMTAESPVSMSPPSSPSVEPALSNQLERTKAVIEVTDAAKDEPGTHSVSQAEGIESKSSATTTSSSSNPVTASSDNQQSPSEMLLGLRAYDTSQWSSELAELWNGRFAQIAFVVVLAQELWQNQGVVQGIKEGNHVNLLALGLTVVASISTGIGFWLMRGDSSSTSASTVPVPQSAGLTAPLPPPLPIPRFVFSALILEFTKTAHTETEVETLATSTSSTTVTTGPGSSPATITVASQGASIRAEDFSLIDWLFPPVVIPPPNAGKFRFREEFRGVY